MLLITLSYVVLAFAGLIALTSMILRIGALLANCPNQNPATRAVTVTIATGYMAIGAGGVILIGSCLMLLSGTPILALMFALGLAALCLGLGFSHAIGTLRAVLQQSETNLQSATVT